MSTPHLGPCACSSGKCLLLFRVSLWLSSSRFLTLAGGDGIGLPDVDYASHSAQPISSVYVPSELGVMYANASATSSAFSALPHLGQITVTITRDSFMSVISSSPV
jgi:hypothetical protein